MSDVAIPLFETWQVALGNSGRFPRIDEDSLKQSFSRDRALDCELNKYSVLSHLWTYMYARKPFGLGCVRLEWTCICGHTSHDDFRELRPGAVASYAEKLRKSGYVTHVHQTTTGPGLSRQLLTAVGNKAAAVGRIISALKLNNHGQNFKVKATKLAPIQCSSTPDVTCRWLHLCINERPNSPVTKLQPLHICKDKTKKKLTDAGLFELLHQTWKAQRTWTDLILFKLRRIEFIKFSAFPDDSIDCIVKNTLPPDVQHYDFAPPPPPEMVPPIAAHHFAHLLTAKCTADLQSSSFYLESLPKKKDKPLKFIMRSRNDQDINIGYGLQFIETPDPSVPGKFMFGLVVLILLFFWVFWSVFKRDLQDAWTIAAFPVSIGTFAFQTWHVTMTS